MSASDHSYNFKGRTYRPAQVVKVVSKSESFGSTYWRVEVDGATYNVGHEMGKSVRIAFQRRGSNRGHHWYGVVRDARGDVVYQERVFKSTRYLGILHDAGVIRWAFEEVVV